MSLSEQGEKLHKQLVAIASEAYTTEQTPATLKEIQNPFLQAILEAIENDNLVVAQTYINTLAGNPKLLITLGNMHSMDSTTLVADGQSRKKPQILQDHDQTLVLPAPTDVLRQPEYVAFFAGFQKFWLILNDSNQLVTELVTDRVSGGDGKSTVQIQVGGKDSGEWFFDYTHTPPLCPIKINNIPNTTSELSLTITTNMPEIKGAPRQEKTVTFALTVSELRNGIDLVK